MLLFYFSSKNNVLFLFYRYSMLNLSKYIDLKYMEWRFSFVACTFPALILAVGFWLFLLGTGWPLPPHPLHRPVWIGEQRGLCRGLDPLDCWEKRELQWNEGQCLPSRISFSFFLCPEVSRVTTRPLSFCNLGRSYLQQVGAGVSQRIPAFPVPGWTDCLRLCEHTLWLWSWPSPPPHPPHPRTVLVCS